MSNHLDITKIRSGLSSLYKSSQISHVIRLFAYRVLDAGIPFVGAAWPHVQLRCDQRGRSLVLTRETA